MRSLLLPSLLAAALAVHGSRAGAAERVTIAAAGDVLFGRYAEDKTMLPVPHVAEPFADVAPLLSAADIAFCNVESPVVEEPEVFYVYQRMSFRAEPEHAGVLARAGFDVVSLANNHIFNMRGPAVPASRDNCEAAGLRALGVGRDMKTALTPTVIDVTGTKVAFFAYTMLVNSGKGFTKDGAVAYFEQEKDFIAPAAPAVRAARRYLGADFVVVSVHWGTEYADHPGRTQKHVARALALAGADLILGHHPHVVEDLVVSRGAVIAYSLGNFMFDQPPLPRRESIILLATLVPGEVRHVTDVEVQPILIDARDHVPKLAAGSAGRAWRQRLAKLVGAIPMRGDDAVAKAP